jgi:hypothetical protein
MEDLAATVRHSLNTLLRELIEGPPGPEAFVLNPGDRGLLASLDALSATDASQRVSGRSSVAAHVDHLRYGLELLNRWTRGENPWRDADFAPSWKREVADDAQWRELRAALALESRAWLATTAQRCDWDEAGLTIALASAVHLAYHLGAIRQIQRGAIGPRESG